MFHRWENIWASVMQFLRFCFLNSCSLKSQLVSKWRIPYGSKFGSEFWIRGSNHIHPVKHKFLLKSYNRWPNLSCQCCNEATVKASISPFFALLSKRRHWLQKGWLSWRKTSLLTLCIFVIVCYKHGVLQSESRVIAHIIHVYSSVSIQLSHRKKLCPFLQCLEGEGEVI